MNALQFFKNLNNKVKLTVAAIAAVAAVGVPAAVLAGYGPNGADRVIYDFSNPAQREGAFDAPRFNSYINTNVYGDERAFLDSKECVVNGADCYKQGVSGGFADKQNAVVVGKEYLVRAYVHNIANPSTNDNPATPAPMDGVGVAKNTRIRFELPEGIANGFTAQARIMADNSIPQMVYDTADFANSAQKFDIEYVPGSAYIFNAAHSAGLPLSDNIISANGTQIGYDQMNGVYPGCFEYSSFVVVRVKVTAPSIEVSKVVSKIDMPKLTDSSESINVKRGETVSWRIDFKNTGTAQINDVVMRDPLLEGLTLVPGSIKLTNANGTQTLPDNALTAGGVNLGDYTVAGNGAIRFRTTVNTKDGVCELTNIAFVRAINVKEVSDSARIVIDDCAPTAKTPKYVCEDLILQVLDNSKRQVRVTTKVAVEHATVKHYSYDFGDGNKIDMTDKASVDHTFAKDGTYIVKVKVAFDVNGQVKIVESENCAASVTFSPNVLPATTTTPNVLPSTGPANLAVLFIVVVIVSAAGYQVYLSRKTA
ncbi:MAG: PKD domain-containing protein [bacterium]|nr:PKD domain-containing protein [bacterium]